MKKTQVVVNGCKSLFAEIMLQSSHLFFKYFLKGEVFNEENVPEGPCIFAINHGSYFDWLVLFPLFKKRFNRTIRFLGKQKLADHPLWHSVMYHSKTIIIDYKSTKSIRKAYLAMNDTLINGNILCIFPEGTRTPDGTLQPGKEGIANIALRGNVPIVPIGLKSFYDAWPRHKKLPALSKCSIHIGKPVEFHEKEYASRSEAKSALTELMMNSIADLLNTEYRH